MRFFLLALPLVVLSACGIANSESRDAGPTGSRTFAVVNFDAVSLEGSDDVRIVRGPVIAVVANGGQKVLDQLDIRVEGSTLRIGRKRSWGMRWGYDKGAVVTVTVPSVKAVDVAGSGDMTLDRADGDAFAGSVAGSGSLRVASLAVKRATLSIAGSGDLMAVGASDDVQFSTSGSGDIDAAKLQNRRADISISGSGNVTTAATESAAISISGSGDATVTGTAKCAVSKSGSGEARCGP
jgi:Putative auto-transporter adhesin, head GIN domain